MSACVSNATMPTVKTEDYELTCEESIILINYILKSALAKTKY